MSRPKRNRQWWLGTVRSWIRSGQTAAEFAEGHGLSEHSLRWWKWKLGEDGTLDEATMRKPASGFVELELAGGSAGFGGFEIVSPDGWTIRVPRDFDENELARVITAMEVES